MSNILGQLLALDDSHQKRSRKNALRAPFGYPGSKERSLPELLPLIPYRPRYVEHFGGTGVVLMARNESKFEVFNDRHSGITAFYKCLADRDKSQQLAQRLQITIHGREYWEWCAETWENMQDDVERAARWFTMLSHSFNQKSWEFGRAIKPPSFMGSKLRNTIDHFDPINHRIRNVQIENLDWRVSLDDFDSYETVHYFDPPYWGVPQTYDHHLTDEDHVELCERIMRAKGICVLSGYDRDNHPYNKFKWTSKHSWQVAISAVGFGFQESSNTAHMEGKLSRGFANETVWIKEIE